MSTHHRESTQATGPKSPKLRPCNVECDSEDPIFSSSLGEEERENVMSNLKDEQTKSNDKFKCDRCERVCLSRRGLLSHKETGCPICDICKLQFPTMNHLHRHYQSLTHKAAASSESTKTKNVPSIVLSSRNPKAGNSESVVIERENVMSNLKDEQTKCNDKFKCDRCERVCLSRRGLVSHKETGCPICDICKQKFPTMNKLKQHYQSLTHKAAASSESTNNVQNIVLSSQNPKAGNSESVVVERENVMSNLKDEQTKSNGEFKCDRCERVFLCRRGLLSHKETGCPICDICKQKFPTMNKLNRHYQTFKHITAASSERKNNMQNIDLSSQNKKVEHILEQNESNKWVQDTNKSNTEASNRQTPNAFKCDLCDHVYLLIENLKKHKEAGCVLPVCDICQLKFSDTDKLRRHYQSFKHITAASSESTKNVPNIGLSPQNEKEGNGESVVIEAISTGKEPNRSHVADEGQTPNFFQCDVCDRVYLLIENLKKHKEAGCVLPVCDICQLKFSNTDKLRRHYETLKHITAARSESTKNVSNISLSPQNEKDRNGESVVIEAISTGKEPKRSHVADEGQTPTFFKCDTCERVYTNKTNLEKHKNTGCIRPFCNTCKVQFSNLRKLVRHYKSKKHKSFEQMSKCSTGMNTKRHYAARTLGYCTVCEWGFKSIRGLERHLNSRTHTNAVMDRNASTQKPPNGCPATQQQNNSKPETLTRKHKSKYKKSARELGQQNLGEVSSKFRHCFKYKSVFKTRYAFLKYRFKVCGPLQCKSCPQKFRNQDLLRQHKKTHEMQQRDVQFYMKLKSNPASSNKQQTRPIESISQIELDSDECSEILKCAKCQKTFQRLYYFQKHMSEECEPKACSKKFRFSCNLKRHTNKHTIRKSAIVRTSRGTGLSLYTCPLCQRKLSNWQNIFKHMGHCSSLDNNKVVCEICNEEMDPKLYPLHIQKEIIQSHAHQFHAGVTAVTCSECKLKMPRRLYKFYHQAAHELAASNNKYDKTIMQRIYICDLCDEQHGTREKMELHTLEKHKLRFDSSNLAPPRQLPKQSRLDGKTQNLYCYLCDGNFYCEIYLKLHMELCKEMIKRGLEVGKAPLPYGSSQEDCQPRLVLVQSENVILTNMIDILLNVNESA
ncbi:unnamed protein product [Orchesella dallaii]|uniref:C2H2-type domain-containing protein n=1 Tax=Orchesella dallaii TaxID=48710 RepID=A0ABP1Q839_9HEXA